MNRRTLLLSGSVLVLGGAVLAGRRFLVADGMSGMNMSIDHSLAPPPPAADRIMTLPEGAPLRDLPQLANIASKPGTFEAKLLAAPARLEFAPGKPTDVLAYNGSVPGPLIVAHEGDKVRIEFVNQVPDQISTIHWHGMPIPANQDGNPMDPVASGASRTYDFMLPEGSAAPYWYHPHPHGLTDQQVFRGLAGAFIVKPRSDPLPADLGDTVLVISDLRLNADGSIPENNPVDIMNGREGDHLLVNGQKRPVLELNPGKSHRFRLYNATNARILRLAFEGQAMTLVGSDGGLLGKPVTGLRELVLAPAERAEVVVDFQATTGAVNLQSSPYERGWMGMGKPAASTTALLTVNLSGNAVASIPLPAKLREIAELGAHAATKKVLLGETMGMAGGAMTMGFLIDGKKFDMGRVDLVSRVGEVELWEVVNTADMDHPFHIHGTQFQIVEREKDGAKSPAPYLAWKDTVNLKRGETVRFKVRQQFAGLRMYHCHILEHETQGMMAVLNVV